MAFTNNSTNLCNLVVIGSVGIGSVMSSVDKQAETDSDSTSSTCLLCQLRRSSSELSFYIIDPIPQFSEEDKNLVVEYWHFITDRISEVGRNYDCY